MSRATTHRAEWVFIAVLVVLCGVLATMQHRWTGELARAEAARIDADFAAQAQQLAGSFDDALTRACGLLVPSGRDLRDLGVARAHQLAWQQWQAAQLRPIFSRVAVAEVRKAALVYQEQDLKTGALRETTWPQEWALLRGNLEDKLEGGPPPFIDPWGLVFEVPVFSRAREMEWVIFEIDESYLAKTWLPELTRQRLGFGGRRLGEVRVRARTDPDKILFESGAFTPAAKPLAVSFNDYGRLKNRPGMHGPGAPPDEPPGAPHNHGPGGGPAPGAWLLEAERSPAALEAMVSASRWRNLGVAMALNALILAAGVLLVRHTRKSRELAGQQMRFVATVSHELRTPLAVIKGAAHNLQRGLVSDPGRVSRYLDVITRNTDNLAEMVEQVLAQAGARRTGSPRLEPLHIAGVLHAALANCEAETQAAACTVETHIADDLPAINGDAPALRRVFQNLVGNAAKHAARGGWIGISAAARDGFIEVTVSDKGPGIPAAEQRRVFDPFVRGAAAQEAQTHGSGLGLSLVKDLVEAHHGTVTLRGDGGDGCTFTVKLPLA